MQSLEALTREAAALGANEPHARAAAAFGDPTQEVARVLQICNACRYCEGFCAVFPRDDAPPRVPEGRRALPSPTFATAAAPALHACQYAPPHDFGVNVPRAMARVRADTYAEYAWPPALGSLYRRNGAVVATVLALALALFLALGAAATGRLFEARTEASAFYAVFPHGQLVAMFLPVFGFAVLALGLGVRRFWRGIGEGPATLPAAGEAAHHALTLKYLDGGHGDGCNEADDRFTLNRRRFPPPDVLRLHALLPVDFRGHALPLPARPARSVRLDEPAKAARHSGWRDARRRRGRAAGIADATPRAAARARTAARWHVGFIGLLLLIAVSGLGLMLSHGTSLLTPTLCVHLGAVMALFLTMPYGKFAHGVFRSDGAADVVARTAAPPAI